MPLITKLYTNEIYGFCGETENGEPVSLEVPLSSNIMWIVQNMWSTDESELRRNIQEEVKEKGRNSEDLYIFPGLFYMEGTKDSQTNLAIQSYLSLRKRE